MNFEEFNDVVPRFFDRTEAGRRLAKALWRYRQKPDTIVAGIPRGGVITAAAVAESLELPVDVVPVGKVQVPGHDELIAGAVSADGVRVMNEDVISAFQLVPERVEAEIHRRLLELETRQRFSRRDQPPFAGRTVIIVDDGIATGSTMDAAIQVVRGTGAKRIVVAVPVGALDSCERLRSRVDHFVCLETPEPFFGIEYWYTHFPSVDERDVMHTVTQTQWSPLALA
ncbi:MAG: phosphoribosyltransferase [Thermoanaerobaculia bacterium]